MSLVSVATLKTYLPEISGSSADTALDSILSHTESIIARFLGFPIYDSGALAVLTAQTYTLYIDGPMFSDQSVLQLPILPIISITSIHSDPNLAYGSSTEITSAEYILDKQLARVILKPETATQGFDTAFRAIKVICSAGYVSAKDELSHAICVYASQLQRNKSSQGKESASQRGSTVQFSPKSMPFEVKELLWPLQSSTMLV